MTSATAAPQRGGPRAAVAVPLRAAVGSGRQRSPSGTADEASAEQPVGAGGARARVGSHRSGATGQQERARLAGGLGALLREARAEAGLAQRDLARRSGVTDRHIRYLETGGRRPRPGTLTALAVVLDPDDDGLLARLTEAAGRSLRPDTPAGLRQRHRRTRAADVARRRAAEAEARIPEMHLLAALAVRDAGDAYLRLDAAYERGEVSDGQVLDALDVVREHLDYFMGLP